MKGRKRETGGSVCHISYSIFNAKFTFADMYEKKAKINQRADLMKRTHNLSASSAALALCPHPFINGQNNYQLCFNLFD